MVFYKSILVSVQNTMLKFSFTAIIYIIIYLNYEEMFSNLESCVRFNIWHKT